jgi:hypothetical protein
MFFITDLKAEEVCHPSMERYEGYSEINLRWAVKKSKKEGKSILLYTKVSYIHRLLVDIITL